MPERSELAGQWIRIAVVTLTLLALWAAAERLQGFDPDSIHYQGMANGRVVMKPFAYRVLGPALAHWVGEATGRSTAFGFMAVGALSGWVLLYGVLSPLLRRRENWWLAALIALLPFWIRIFHNYFLPDLLHAALCMAYLALLRARRWAWAAAMLVPMYLARESTLLIVLVAVPVLWRLAGRTPALLHAAGGLAGMVASKLAVRNALANMHGMNDTLYMAGKVPWNVSKNLFGITLWTNTLPSTPPIRIWNVPPWMPSGDIHQIGYSSFNPETVMGCPILLLTSFGLASCFLVCLTLRVPLRKLLPRDEPYLCIAAVYGLIAFVAAPALGATMQRLFDYGWPLFLVYLPVITPRVWRAKWPAWTGFVLLGLHLVATWTVMLQGAIFRMSETVTLAILLVCNIVAMWLLLRIGGPGLVPQSASRSAESKSPATP